jgi:hypothetical protein
MKKNKKIKLTAKKMDELITQPMTMVLLPQTVWQEMNNKINQLLNQREENPTVQQVRIPLIQFKNDVKLQRRYGLTYTVVRRISNNNLLRSYNDPERRRFKWTTHEDIIDYLNQIRTAGIKQ